MDKTSDIIFFVIAITVVLVLLTVLVINLLLIGRNRRLKHRNEVLRITADYQKELMKTQIEVVENTLNDMSQQLHDDVGQMIALSIVQLNNIRTDDINFHNKISEIRESVQASMHSVREISKTLSTDYLTSFGIYESLQRLINRLNKTSGLIINVDFQKSILFNSPANEIFVFRIMQELITNTVKHAKATEITVSINQEGEDIIIKYADNGLGIEKDKLQNIRSKNSLGFTNIFKRADLMKGEISLENNKKGFVFMLSFPNL